MIEQTGEEENAFDRFQKAQSEVVSRRQSSIHMKRKKKTRVKSFQ